MYLWQTKDGKNTYEERNNRAKLLDEFVKGINIKLRCGFNDRQEMKEEAV